MLLVAKKNGKLRLSVDMRVLNKSAILDKYSLPRVDDLLDRLPRAIFSKIDLHQGFHQVIVVPEHTKRTAFRTQFGNFEFFVMPFGWVNGPGVFMRLMNTVLFKHLNICVIIFLDDILVYSSSVEQHVTDLMF